MSGGPSTLQSWFLAARPKTLTGALAPVMIAIAATWNDTHGINVVPAILCMLFAVLMQVDANFINDYFDCAGGIDGEERLGPERACSQGWISMHSMRVGISVTTILSGLVGLPLLFYTDYYCIIVGIVCILFTFLYTTLFSRIAMGDILVVMFFGLIPVSCTYYIQTGQLTMQVWLLALAQGLVTDCLLIVNNFRDRDTDLRHGKITLVTLIGPKAAIWLYCLIGIVSTLLVTVNITLYADIFDVSLNTHMLPVCAFLPLHFACVARMIRIKRGRALNSVLAMTALSIFVFALTISISLVVQ